AAAPEVENVGECRAAAPEGALAGAEADTLGHQRGDRDRPALARLPDAVGVVDDSAVEEDLVEVALASDLADLTAGHRVLVHVEDEAGDAGVAREVGMAQRQQQSAIGDVGVRGPDLLPLDAPVTVFPGGARGQRSQVAACLRLAEELAPDLVA